MSHAIPCPHCSTTIKVPAVLTAGEKGYCPKCRAPSVAVITKIPGGTDSYSLRKATPEEVAEFEKERADLTKALDPLKEILTKFIQKNGGGETGDCNNPNCPIHHPETAGGLEGLENILPGASLTMKMVEIKPGDNIAEKVGELLGQPGTKIPENPTNRGSGQPGRGDPSLN